MQYLWTGQIDGNSIKPKERRQDNNGYFKLQWL